MPTITGVPASSSEGSPIHLGSSVVEPSPVDVPSLDYQWTVSKAHGGFIDPSYAGGQSKDFDFTPDDNGSYTVTLAVRDKDGDVGTTSEVITVDNVAPVATIITADVPPVAGEFVLAAFAEDVLRGRSEGRLHLSLVSHRTGGH